MVHLFLNSETFWDSGKIESFSSIHIEYQGHTALSDQSACHANYTLQFVYFSHIPELEWRICLQYDYKHRECELDKEHLL
ncbi:hypothetical protein J31TS3_33040 [Paenibacillus lactis]|nr:hypothetical protein J31TS3_33040 [Paenibacillus lactis]